MTVNGDNKHNRKLVIEINLADDRKVFQMENEVEE